MKAALVASAVPGFLALQTWHEGLLAALAVLAGKLLVEPMDLPGDQAFPCSSLLA